MTKALDGVATTLLSALATVASWVRATAATHHMPGWVAATVFVVAVWLLGSRVNRLAMWVALAAAVYIGWKVIG